MTQLLQPFAFKYTRSNAGLSLAQPLIVEPNQVIWLVGNSGSGKTTFLHLLKGFYPEFVTGQLNGTPPDIFKDAAYIAQNPLSQIVHEHVGEEFVFSMENADWSFERMHAAQHWLDEFDLASREFAPTNFLSHGLAQRLLLASMLASESKTIVFDEPSAFLNPAMRDDFYTMLHALKGKVGMLLIDHHPHAADFTDVCWHVSDNGEITMMSVDDWLATTHDVDEFWPIEPLTECVELRAENLSIGYKNAPLFTANFILQSGDCAVLLGDNGAGKSTLFNTLAGIQKPLGGRLHLNAQMAYVFQHPDSHFFFDTIAQELQQLGVTDVESALQHIGLQGRADASPHQLSEGQKRRLTLLYPCLQKRPLILLDEPTFGQDAANTARIVQLINALKRAGYALIVITHDSEVQHAIATTVWRIDQQQLFIS